MSVPRLQAPREGAVLGAAPEIRLTRDAFRLSAFLLVILSISKFQGYFAILRLLRPAFLAFGFCLAYAFANPRRVSSGNIFRFWPPRIVVALGFVACCSAVFGISLGHSAVFILQDYWKTLATTFLLIFVVRHATDLRRLTWSVGIGGIVLAYISIFIVGISKTSSAVTYDANDVGTIMAMCLPLTLLMAQTSRGWARWFSLTGVALIATTIAKTQSRGAFIGLLCVAASLLFMLPGTRFAKRFLYVAIAAVAMSLTAPPGYWQSMKSFLSAPTEDYNWDAVNGRRQVAKRGIEYMLAYPIFGVGINNFGRAEGTISEKARDAAPNQGVRWTAPHNSFVQAGAETGLTGLVLWVSLFVGGMLSMWRLHRRMPPEWRNRGTEDQRFLYYLTGYLPVAFVGFAVTASFVSFAWIQPIYTLAALVTGAHLAFEHERAGPVRAVHPQPEFRSSRWAASRLPLRGQPRVSTFFPALLLFAHFHGN